MIEVLQKLKEEICLIIDEKISSLKPEPEIDHDLESESTPEVKYYTVCFSALRKYHGWDARSPTQDAIKALMIESAPDGIMRDHPMVIAATHAGRLNRDFGRQANIASVLYEAIVDAKYPDEVLGECMEILLHPERQDSNQHPLVSLAHYCSNNKTKFDELTKQQDKEYCEVFRGALETWAQGFSVMPNMIKTKKLKLYGSWN